MAEKKMKLSAVLPALRKMQKSYFGVLWSIEELIFFISNIKIIGVLLCDVL